MLLFFSDYEKNDSYGIPYSKETDSSFHGHFRVGSGQSLFQSSNRAEYFVVNPEGKIKVVELNDNNIGRDASELLRKVEAAQFVATHDGEVCQALCTKCESVLTE